MTKDALKAAGITLFTLLLISVLLVGVLLAAVPSAMQEQLAREGALIEGTSAALLLIAAGVAAYIAFRDASPGWGSFAFLMIAGFLREIDAHKAWTTMSIFKTRFYLSPEVALGESWWVAP
jgi:hypothetical protein